MIYKTVLSILGPVATVAVPIAAALEVGKAAEYAAVKLGIAPPSGYLDAGLGFAREILFGAPSSLPPVGEGGHHGGGAAATPTGSPPPAPPPAPGTPAVTTPAEEHHGILAKVKQKICHWCNPSVQVSGTGELSFELCGQHAAEEQSAREFSHSLVAGWDKAYMGNAEIGDACGPMPSLNDSRWGNLTAYNTALNQWQRCRASSASSATAATAASTKAQEGRMATAAKQNAAQAKATQAALTKANKATAAAQFALQAQKAKAVSQMDALKMKLVQSNDKVTQQALTDQIAALKQQHDDADKLASAAAQKSTDVGTQAKIDALTAQINSAAQKPGGMDQMMQMFMAERMASGGGSGGQAAPIIMTVPGASSAPAPSTVVVPGGGGGGRHEHVHFHEAPQSDDDGDGGGGDDYGDGDFDYGGVLQVSGAATHSEKQTGAVKKAQLGYARGRVQALPTWAQPSMPEGRAWLDARRNQWASRAAEEDASLFDGNGESDPEYEGADEEIDPEIAETLGLGGATTLGEANLFHSMRQNPDFEGADFSALTSAWEDENKTAAPIGGCSPLTGCGLPPAMDG